MGIFYVLKHSEHPVALKELNEFLKYSAKLSEANANVEFIKQCTEINRYPESIIYWNLFHIENHSKWTGCAMRPIDQFLGNFWPWHVFNLTSFYLINEHSYLFSNRQFTYPYFSPTDLYKPYISEEPDENLPIKEYLCSINKNNTYLLFIHSTEKSQWVSI